MNNPSDPLARPQSSPYKLTAEDQRILQQCNKESFYLRCLPLSTIFGGLTYLAVKSGYWKPHVSWGATPKVMGAVIMGYFVGKLSYQSICAEKFMAIPDSPIGASLRARKLQGRGGLQDTLTLDLPGYSLPEEGSPSEYRDDQAPGTFTDLDTDRPYQGLDDSFDTPQRPEDFVLPPQATTPNSYDELRRKNREEFESKTRAFRSTPPEQAQRPQEPYNPPSATSEPFSRYKPSTNVYGDVFEK